MLTHISSLVLSHSYKCTLWHHKYHKLHRVLGKGGAQWDNFFIYDHRFFYFKDLELNFCQTTKDTQTQISKKKWFRNMFKKNNYAPLKLRNFLSEYTPPMGYIWTDCGAQWNDAIFLA